MGGEEGNFMPRRWLRVRAAQGEQAGGLGGFVRDGTGTEVSQAEHCPPRGQVCLEPACERDLV